MEIPVYLFAGFLDSGKTNFINGILADGFSKDNNTLLICCEEGEEEYQSSVLHNVSVVTVEEEEELNIAHLKELEEQYHPDQILIEYNGMWPLDSLSKILPENWILYQILTFVEASTFELYVKNMGQIMMEKIINADMIVFNRCTPELRDALRARNLRMVNRRADIYLENEDGTSEEYFTGNESPFDMTQDVIEIPDDDYGIWYVDAMDYPERYEGKKVHLKLEMCHSRQMPGVCCPGRFAMVCCEQDVTFLGVIAKGKELYDYENHDWVDLIAEVRAENHPAYKGEEGPVLHVCSIKRCEKPKDEIVSF